LEFFAVAKAEYNIYNNDNTSIDIPPSLASTIIVEVKHCKYNIYKLKTFVRTIHHNKENNRILSIYVDTSLSISVID
jgi:hypothetical protein